MTSHEVDRELLYLWVDRRRRRRNVRWRIVAEETGIPRPSLTRFGRGNGVSADAVASLIVWSGVPAQIVIRKRA